MESLTSQTRFSRYAGLVAASLLFSTRSARPGGSAPIGGHCAERKQWYEVKGVRLEKHESGTNADKFWVMVPIYSL